MNVNKIVRQEEGRPLREALAVVMIRRRGALGMRQDEIATHSGLTRQYISMVERQERMPSIETLLKLCKGLQVRSTEFMSELEGIVDAYHENRPIRYLLPNPAKICVAEPTVKAGCTNVHAKKRKKKSNTNSDI